jgi:hypothetical protein
VPSAVSKVALPLWVQNIAVKHWVETQETEFEDISFLSLLELIL